MKMQSETLPKFAITLWCHHWHNEGEKHLPWQSVHGLFKFDIKLNLYWRFQNLQNWLNFDAQANFSSDMSLNIEYAINIDVHIPCILSFWWCSSSYINKVMAVQNLYLFSNLMTSLSFMLSHEYWVVRNRYSRLLFTSEDRLCTNFHVQEQSTNMTSQY